MQFLPSSAQLTVEIAAQQLHSQSGVQHRVQRVNPDVASHKGRKEGVFFHSGAVDVAQKSLKQSPRVD